jgi:HSP20 family protein
MHYNQSCAAKGENAARMHHVSRASYERAPVNIYKTESSFEMLVFAPGRIKEHFQVELNGTQLSVSYSPPPGFQKPDWILREYSRGGFQRQFTIDGSIDVKGISASYLDGVLHISLPIATGPEPLKQQVPVN